MTISLEHFSFNEILHFKFSGYVDSSKTARSQTSSVSKGQKMIKKLHIYGYFKIWHLTAVFYQNTPIRNFLKVFLMITLAPRQKILSQIAFAWTVAFILEASNRSKITRHYCRTKESRAFDGKKEVRPQRVAARP